MGLKDEPGLAADSGREGVVLGVEVVLAGLGRVLDRLLVEARAAGIGKDLSGAVVEGDEHAVVDVPGLQAVLARGAWADDPGVVVGVALGGDTEVREIGDVGGRTALVGAEDVGLQPLLGRLLHAHVQGRHDPVAARVDPWAVRRVDARVAEQVGQLLPDQEVELRRDVRRPVGRVEDRPAPTPPGGGSRRRTSPSAGRRGCSAAYPPGSRFGVALWPRRERLPTSCRRPPDRRLRRGRRLRAPGAGRR